MARRRGYRRGETGRGRIGRFGFLLALLALLCQGLALSPQATMAMPMPASTALPADAALFAGGYILCQDDDGSPASDSSPDKAPCQHCGDCLLCQAFHASGGLVPPPLPVLPAPTVEAATFVAVPIADRPFRLAATAHQPRAPPSVTSL
ncbi:hypothetical protein GCM10011611_29980 [Aliidongia dinghuensis]|uniref:DUF2946 domain-containing protein n=1 Tax=Aliidongia dinghuensis TaxID=1867774 RepID=A0A8J2YU37_9PROT|nr:DUF2946 family protein [Aliidongia dinghuensis]GGF21924.1 hypothetical protein GCM10011611_29980 [Aliidongia dinghuensis]